MQPKQPMQPIAHCSQRICWCHRRACRRCCCSNADVEQQIGHLRAQLLRSEQDNELMRVKLEAETAEREKAQKQVRRNAVQKALGCVLQVAHAD